MTDVSIGEGVDQDIVAKLLNPEMVFVGKVTYDGLDDAGLVLITSISDEVDPDADEGFEVRIHHTHYDHDHTPLTRLIDKRVRVWLEVLPDA